jgi:ABC-2 type transport system permease protein
MRKILTLARRELSAYFFSLMAYVVAFLFLLLVGVVFCWGINVLDIKAVFRSGGESTLRPLFKVLAYGLVVVVPLLTMRLVAEEFRSGTVEALMTAPVTDIQVVAGKFLGAFVVYLALLASTVVFFILVAIFGEPDWGVVATGYLGMVLLGCLYISVGLFASTLTSHQLVAGLIGIGILGFFTGGIYVLASRAGVYAAHVGKLNVITYFEHFTKGVFDTRGLVFFLSGTLFFLFLSWKVLESRRWR